MLRRDDADAEKARTEIARYRDCSTGEWPNGRVICTTPAGGGWNLEKQ